jgi:hypothetical protein
MDSVEIARRCAIPGEHIVVNGPSGERGAFFNRQAPTPLNDPENCVEWSDLRSRMTGLCNIASKVAQLAN